MLQTACDLQPRIVSLPDSVGEFISNRYPALLADPYAEAEIYNSAATDYGMYAAPDLLYGSPDNDEYVLYASLDDYILPPQLNAQVQDADVGEKIIIVNEGDVDSADDAVAGKAEDVLVVPVYGVAGIENDSDEITVQKGDTLYALAKKYNTSAEDLAKLNKINPPYQLKVGQKLQVAREIKPVPADVLTINKPVSGVRTATKVELKEVVVGAGDTLYSISRKYAVPVNDLAVMNDLSAPFNLAVGQKLRVPNLNKAPVAQVVEVKTTEKQAVKVVVADEKKVAQVVQSTPVKQKAQSAKSKNVEKQKKNEPEKVQVAKPVKKISSDPNKKLPAITARSSSKFTWPVRGKILSNYGAKSNGLFNDGINISAARGSVVKAAENGVVAYAGNEVKGMGNLIIVQHDGGWMTVYAHLDSMVVRRGAKVTVGQKIGTVGKTGKVDSPQLHFEIRKGTKAYNPTSYMKK